MHDNDVGNSRLCTTGYRALETGFQKSFDPGGAQSSPSLAASILGICTLGDGVSEV